MAYQPKSYRKFLAGTVSAAVVASAIAPVASAAFTDLAGNVHADDIATLVAKGYIKGYADGTFKPNKTLTRGEAAIIFSRILKDHGVEVPASAPKFADVSANNVELTEAVAIVSSQGVMTGDGARFNPNANITREQMAKVLVEAFKLTKPAGHVSKITDLDKAGSWARDYIQTLEANGVTKNTQFNPKADVTRGQFASFVVRALSLSPYVKAPSVKAIKATNNTTVEVHFVDNIDDISALKFSIDGGVTVANAVVKQTAPNVAVLTTSKQEVGKEYTVSANGQVLGKFKGGNSAIPSAIEVVEQSVQGVVGKEVTLKAKVKVDAGQSPENIPVTFNVDGDNNNLNKDLTAEVYTDANGVATYTYTQYAAGVDHVVAYPTGNRGAQSVGKVYWGVQSILTVTSEDAVVDNGAVRTYKVKYVNPVTGAPVANAKLNVTFKENLNDLDGTTKNDTDATVRKTSGVYVTPYQDKAVGGSYREEYVEVYTNAQGEATFTVTGKNTAATPIVFVDANGNNRYETTELQAVAGKATFQGVQVPYEISFDRVEDFVAAMSGEYGQENPIAYKVKVLTNKTDKDGNKLPYVGGTIKVAISENQDDVLSNNTPALISAAKDSGYVNNGVIRLTLNDKGEATFYVKSNVDNSKATPVAWIDLNTAGNPDAAAGNDKLEKENEPYKVAPTVTFLKSLVVKHAYSLNKPKAGDYINGDTMVWTASLLNQSGAKSETSGVRSATFVITNTSNAKLTINPKLIDEAGVAYTNKTITYNGSTLTQKFENGDTVVLEPGASVTIFGIAPKFVNDTNVKLVYSTTDQAKLEVAVPGNSGELSVNAQVETVKRTANGDTRNDFNTYDCGTEVAKFITGVETITSGTVTGEIIGYEHADKAGKFGRVVVKERFTGKTKVYHYGNEDQALAENLFAALNADFTGTPNSLGKDFNKFEDLMTIGDQIQIKAGQEIHLFNADKSTGTGSSGNAFIAQAPVSVTAAKAVDSDKDGKADKVVVTFSKAVKDANVVLGAFSLSNGTVSGFSTGAAADDNVIELSVTATGLDVGTLTVADTANFALDGGKLAAGSVTVAPALATSSAFEGVVAGVKEEFMAGSFAYKVSGKLAADVTATTVTIKIGTQTFTANVNADKTFSKTVVLPEDVARATVEVVVNGETKTTEVEFQEQ